jgi:hypothetical protein
LQSIKRAHSTIAPSATGTLKKSKSVQVVKAHSRRISNYDRQFPLKQLLHETFGDSGPSVQMEGKTDEEFADGSRYCFGFRGRTGPSNGTTTKRL